MKHCYSVDGMDGEPLAEVGRMGALLRTNIWLEGRLIAINVGTPLNHPKSGRQAYLTRFETPEGR